MKKNTKIIIWSIVGIAVATGAFFGIRALVKNSKRSKSQNATIPPISDKNLVKSDPLNSKTIIQSEADAQATKIFNLEEKAKTLQTEAEKNAVYIEINALKQGLYELGYNYKDGKAIKK